MRLSSADFFFFFFNTKFQGKESYLPQMLQPLQTVLCFVLTLLLFLFCLAYLTCPLLVFTKENPISPSLTMAYPVALP